MRLLWVALFVSTLLGCVVCPPVDGKKKEKDEERKGNEADDDLGLEYGRYLQQVVQLLEEDKDFAKKLENVSSEQIRTGHIAKELEFVKHNIRTKLDELKRIEVDRLRKLVQEQMERTELGLYRDEDGRLLESPDGRRWRTIPGQQGINRKGLKLPQHVDLKNPHSFEVDDLKKLIQTATKDLEELDRQRREEFKKYEMEKELKYRESLKNMTDDQKAEAEKHHKEMIEKHKEHPKVHHPGSKPQLEQVWEEEDHLPRDEFNPKTFFAMHDVNSDGHLDEKEVEAILMPEVKKMYDPKNEEDDPQEMEEEYHRMREHIFNETDKDKDGLISLEEFIRMTQQQEFQQDDGWKGLDEQTVYSEAELEEYMRQRQMQMGMQYQPYYGGDPRMYYDVPNAQGMPPPHMNYEGQPQQPHPGMNQQYQHQQPPQNGMHPQQFQGAHPQQQQQFQGVHPQQQQLYQGVHPQQQQPYQGAHPQQQQQQYQGGHPQQQQQQYQGGHPQQQQQFQGGHPQQQFQGGYPPQQAAYQGAPQQHYQGSSQQFVGAPPQHVQGSPQAQANAPPQQAQASQPQQPSIQAAQPQASSAPNAVRPQQGSPQPPAPAQQLPQKP